MHGMFLKNIKYRDINNVCVYSKVRMIFSNVNLKTFLILECKQKNFYLFPQIAIFLYKWEEYVMRPEHCMFDVGRNMHYKIDKMKRNPSSDSYAVKSGTE